MTAGLLAAATLAVLASSDPAAASSGEATLEPRGRGLQLLAEREAILLDQSERADRAGRTRARALYRVLRVAGAARRDGDISVSTSATTFASASTSSAGAFEPLPSTAAPVERQGGDRRTADGHEDRPSGRSLALATLALQRDLSEARQLRAALDRVRVEQAELRSRFGARAMTSSAPPKPSSPPRPYLWPVEGAMVSPFGVDRDEGTGAWIFRAAVSFATSPTEAVRSPAAGRVVRVAPSIAGGIAVVVSHKHDRWTTVLSGLCAVAVAPTQVVRAGDPIGQGGCASRSTLRMETWHDRDPIDPMSLLPTPLSPTSLLPPYLQER